MRARTFRCAAPPASGPPPRPSRPSHGDTLQVPWLPWRAACGPAPARRQRHVCAAAHPGTSAIAEGDRDGSVLLRQLIELKAQCRSASRASRSSAAACSASTRRSVAPSASAYSRHHRSAVARSAAPWRARPADICGWPPGQAGLAKGLETAAWLGELLLAPLPCHCWMPRR